MKAIKEFAVVIVLSLFASRTALAQVNGMPRSPLPPWPAATLGNWGFDQGLLPTLQPPAPVGLENATRQPSWSGYSLVRDGSSVSPVAIPVIEAGRTNLALDSGTVQFWFRSPSDGKSVPADLSTLDAASATETKQPDYARLLELVNVSGKTPQTWWSLYYDSASHAVYFSGQGPQGAMDYLKAGVNLGDGEWHFLALSYSPKSSELYADAKLLATGAGVPPVPAGQRDSMGLLVGSDALGQHPAGGEFEELATLNHTLENPNDVNALALYWAGTRRTALLGPVGTPEEEKVKQALLKEMFPVEKGVEMEEDGGGGPGPMALMFSNSGFYLEIPTNGVSGTNLLTIILHNTIEDEVFDVMTTTNLLDPEWAVEQSVIGAAGTDTTVTLALNGRTNLFVKARFAGDSDGDGLSDWWEIEHGMDPDSAGTSGVSDGYADPDGDGWTNIEEMRNGTSPAVFNSPRAPANFAARTTAGSNDVTLSWSSAAGSVTGYAIDQVWSDGSVHALATVGASTNVLFSAYWGTPETLWYGFHLGYRIRATYAGGIYSEAAYGQLVMGTPGNTVTAKLVRGPAGRWVVAFSALPASVQAVRLVWVGYGSSGVEILETQTNSVSAITNGLLTISDATALAHLGHKLGVQSLGSGGGEGDLVDAGKLSMDAPAFVDGREHLKQNLAFLLRTAGRTNLPYSDAVAFSFFFRDGWDFIEEPLRREPGFVDSSFFLNSWQWVNGYKSFVRLNNLLPYDLNSFFGAQLYDNTNYTGPFSWPGDTTTISMPAALGQPNPYWIGQDFDRLGDWGITVLTNDSVAMAAGQTNLYGLSLQSALLYDGIGFPFNWATAQLYALNAGNVLALAAQPLTSFAAQSAAPSLQLADYYFVPLEARGADLSWFDTPAIGAAGQLYPTPLVANFSLTNQTPPALMAAVGQPMVLAGWSRWRVANGNTNKFGNLGQYFDKAYKVNSSGTVTTNQTGVLSPYGEFLPTEPGPVALVTMADIDTGQRGTGVVNVIKLQLDVNHDGVMDPTFAGPDNTSWQRPFTFWVNGDREEPGTGGNLDRDVQLTPFTPNTDYSFGQIRTARNLEDFARLWLCGMPTLPTNQNCSVQIGWSLIDSGSPKLRLYWAGETNGGIAYLTNATTASQQITNYNSALGEITPTSSLSLPLSWFTNGSPRYFLFEAGAPGKGALTLTILQGSNTIAETSTWLDFHDIKDFYEEVAITNVVQTWPEMVQTNLNSGFKVQSPATASIGDATQMAIFVHGWRMPYSDYLTFSQTMLKRLYWQGYQGKFAAVRWPTRSSDTDTNGLDFTTYNRSEYISFQSGTGAALYFYDLRQRFPDYTISACSHSQGGIIMMEALSELASANEDPLDHYVMMETAVPAHCYDPTVTNLPSLMSMEQSIPTPNTYSNYAGAITNALRGGKVINFFNPVDFALVSGWNGTGLGSWENNQELLKPLVFFGYVYLATNQTAYVITNQFTEAFGVTNLQNRIVTNPLELMPFVARPRSKAVGVQNGVGRAVNGAQLNLQSEFGYTAAVYDHSGQFNRNIQTPQVQGFYFNLLRALTEGEL